MNIKFFLNKKFLMIAIPITVAAAVIVGVSIGLAMHSASDNGTEQLGTEEGTIDSTTLGGEQSSLPEETEPTAPDESSKAPEESKTTAPSEVSTTVPSASTTASSEVSGTTSPSETTRPLETTCPSETTLPSETTPVSPSESDTTGTGSFDEIVGEMGTDVAEDGWEA